MAFKTRRLAMVPGLAAACAVAALVACEQRREALRLADLSSTERLYVERFVTLERARAVALADPDRGDAILDSLSRAWGDSALEWTLNTLPRQPRRVAAVFNLLGRVLAAEADSLVQSPLPRRLRAPLPEPPL